MLEIAGKRGSGKTTALLCLAAQTGAVVVEPTYSSAEIIRMKAKELGLKDVTVISATQFFRETANGINRADSQYLIDELDTILDMVNVKAYSKTV